MTLGRTPGPGHLIERVAVEALKMLTAIVNVTSLYASGGDRDRAVAVLLALHDGGHDLNPEDARAWGDGPRPTERRSQNEAYPACRWQHQQDRQLNH
jgi:hypothetical protein